MKLPVISLCTRKTFLFLLFLGLLLPAAGCRQDHSPASPTYRIGYMICNSEEETLKRFTPLTTYLSKKLGVKLEAVAIDTLQFSQEIDNLDFTHTNSLLYIMYNRFNGLEILATEKRGELGARSKGLVVTLKKSNIHSLDDLKSKSMIFGPMLAPTAFMSQAYALKKQGFSIDDDLKFYDFPTGAFKHEKVIYSVLFGKYDAGAFPYYDFEIMIKQGKVDPEDFVVLAEGPLIPYCNFAVTQRVDEVFAKRFKNALLSLKDTDMVEGANGERVRILERAELQGFADATDADFDIVRRMAKETNMPPYQQY